MTLSKRISLLFSLAILLVIFIVSLISNAMINSTFDEYLEGEKSETVEQIGEEISDLYVKNNDELYIQQIDSYASLENLDITIRDQNNQIVYSSYKQSGMHRMHESSGMSRRHQEMMSDHDTVADNYIEKAFDLIQENKKVGTVSIGYIDNSLQSENAQFFKQTLSRILIIASVIALVIGMMTSVFLANSLTAPLIAIKNTSREIQQGNLSKKTEPATSIIEIQELSDSINYLGQSLAEQEQIRQAYASDISHELRTPVATLKSHVEAMMDGVWEANIDHLTILMHEINRLALLIDDLKDSFNSVETPMILHKQSSDLSKAMQEIVTTFQPIAQQKELTLTKDIESDINVWMDPDRIKQVMYNLLMNAVKYTDPGGKIFLELKAIPSQQLEIVVSDTGLGIPKKDLPYLFNRFYRIDNSRTKETGGSGLGLAIAQSIIHQHGGNIEVESVLNQGSRFVIQLPRQ